MKFDSKCHLSTKLFAEHSKIASQPINWKVNKCHFVVLVVNKCHFVVLVVNKCHFVVLVVNKCHFVVLVVRKRSRNDFTLLKRVLKLCNNVANYGTNYFRVSNNRTFAFTNFQLKWVIPFTCLAFKLILKVLNWSFTISSTTSNCPFLQAQFLHLSNKSQSFKV